MADAALKEGEFIFRFPETACAVALDKTITRKPQGLSFVDFVVRRGNGRFLIEVKNPSCAQVPDEERGRFAAKMSGETLIADELVPKARDSYCYLHLMGQEETPALFVFMVGLRNVPFDRSLLGAFKDRLLKRLRHEADVPWKRQYISDCLVLTEETWEVAFPEFALAIVAE